MDTPFSALSDSRKREGIAFVFLLILLSINSAANATVGFSLPIFLSTIVPAIVLAFLYPRSGLVAAISVTILFERFFTLFPIIIGETAYKFYSLDAVLLSSFVGMTLLALRRLGRGIRFRMSDILVLAFFAVVSGIFLAGIVTGSEGVATAFSTWKNYVFYGAVYFLVAASVRTIDDVRVAGRIFLGVTFSATAFLILGLVRGGGLWTEFTPLSTPGIRYLAFPHAFYFSLAFLVVLMTLPEQGDSKGNQGFLRNFSFLSILAVGILASLMRHLWIGIAATVGIIALVRPRIDGQRLFSHLRTLAVPAVGIVFISVFLLSVMPGTGIDRVVPDVADVVRERIVSIGSTTDESLVWRDEVWQSSISRFSERPFLGIGFGASVPVEFGEYHQYVEVRNMHNSWLAMLIQTGLIGMGSFVAFLVALISRLFKTRMTGPGFSEIRTALVALLLFQGLVFFSQPYLETNLLGIFFWVTLGLARAFTDVMERSRDGKAI